MKNGEKLLNSLREELKNDKEKVRYFLTQDAEDNFISMISYRHNISLLETKIRILENKGLSSFDVLLHLDGTIVNNAKLCDTRFGEAYRIEKEDGSVEWVNAKVKEKTLTKKGYKIGKVKKPAWAELEGSGNGLGSLNNVYVSVFKSNKNYWLD